MPACVEGRAIKYIRAKVLYCNTVCLNKSIHMTNFPLRDTTVYHEVM